MPQHKNAKANNPKTTKSPSKPKNPVTKNPMPQIGMSWQQTVTQPTLASANDILQLQRTVGNQATTNIIQYQRGGRISINRGAKGIIQRDLTSLSDFADKGGVPTKRKKKTNSLYYQIYTGLETYHGLKPKGIDITYQINHLIKQIKTLDALLDTISSWKSKHKKSNDRATAVNDLQFSAVSELTIKKKDLLSKSRSYLTDPMISLTERRKNIELIVGSAKGERMKEFRVTMGYIRSQLEETYALEKSKYEVALNLHKADVDSMKTWMYEGLDQERDIRLRNTCEWLLAEKTKLYVVTPTADTDQRALLAGKEGVYSYFPNPYKGGPTVFQDHGDYNWENNRDNSNVCFNKKTVNAWRSGGHIAMTSQIIGKGKMDALAVLKHEVQHDADEHDEYEAQAEHELGHQIGHALTHYKTEYRSYAYQGAAKGQMFDHLDNSKRTKYAYGLYWTPKQYAIFMHIYGAYSYVAPAWGPDGGLSPQQMQFRMAVNNYANPDTEGYNKYNSVRISEIFDVLKRIPGGLSNMEDAGFQKLLAAIDNLDETDVNYLSNPDEAVALNEAMKYKLANNLQTPVEQALIMRGIKLSHMKKQAKH